MVSGRDNEDRGAGDAGDAGVGETRSTRRDSPPLHLAKLQNRF